MDNLKLYEINGGYITYLSAYAPHLFQNKKFGQKNERKYIGIVLQINGFDYFAPLSSFKDKHRLMKEGLDFIKIKDYAVINLNNMFPVPLSETKYVDIRIPNRIINNGRKVKVSAVIFIKICSKDGEASSLAKRCNDFLLLEKACADYMK